MKLQVNEALLISIKNILAVVALMVPLYASAQAPSCAGVFTGGDASVIPHGIDGSWRKYSADSFMAFRANAPHYWNWLSENRISIMQPTGVVAGDPHILNFGDVQSKDGNRRLVLIDVDDAGVNAPLAGDFLRYFIGNQISSYKVSAKSLFNAYLDGLSGKSMDKPNYLKDIKSKSDRNYADFQDKRISKLISGNIFSKDAGLTRIEDTSIEVRSLYKKVLPTFEAEMKDCKILDVGYRAKEFGGSQGLPRFLFLIEKNQEKHIWEFKMETDPATSLYVRQPDALTRFQYVVSTYRSSSEPVGPFRFIEVDNYVFLLRERSFGLIDLDPAKAKTDKDINDGKEMSLYIANRMGLTHGAQPTGADLKKRLEEPEAFDNFKQLAKQYISNMTQLNAP